MVFHSSTLISKLQLTSRQPTNKGISNHCMCVRERTIRRSSKCDLLDELGHSQVSAQSSKFSVWMVSLTYAETAETVKRLVARAVVQTVPFEVSL